MVLWRGPDWKQGQAIGSPQWVARQAIGFLLQGDLQEKADRYKCCADSSGSYPAG
jgi:hypothetical protein